MKYRCVATTPEGFVQQVAVSYIRHGYWWYVSGRIPPGKDAEQIDQKLIEKYDINISERKRIARKKQGLANMQYIRYQDFFLLLVSQGHHPIKQREKKQIRDCRRRPIKFRGYSISYRRSGVTPKGGGDPKWHSSVRIEPKTYREIKTYLLDRAKHRNVESLQGDFNQQLAFARYAPVRRQIKTIHRAVNKVRVEAGFEELAGNVVSYRYQVVKPFGSNQH
ncbi:MAG: hypothetical protein KDA65_18810 [Planctomycetaceae bacterium]|nr:hypothetical protein [Planctomycetaceae bacterium]